MARQGLSLHRSARDGEPYSVAACLANDDDPNGLDHHGHTALYIASKYGHLQVAKDLIKAGADVNIRTPEGASAVDAALQWGHARVLRALVWANADLGSSGRSQPFIRELRTTNYS